MTVYTLINELHAKKIKLWQEDGQLKFKAPKGAFTDEIRQQLVANKRDIVAFLQQVSAASDVPPITRVEKSDFDQLPLSFSQERLWFINQLDPESVSYNIPVASLITGELDIDHVEAALKHIIARHDNLRTAFPSQNGQPRQLIADELGFELERFDVSRLDSDDEKHARAKELCQTEAVKPFDLATGPLLRALIIRLSPEQHVFMLTIHHIISDGWSLGVLIQEFKYFMECIREDKAPRLPDLPIQYADYAVWQRNWLEKGGVLCKQLTYWKKKLAGVPESLDLMTDFPRPKVQSFSGAIVRFKLDKQLTARLKALSDKHGCTLYMTLLAILKVLMYRYTRQSDICLGGVIANRHYSETESLIGMFINTLALRSFIDGEAKFSDVLAQVKTTCLEAYENQDTPFEKVVNAVLPKRNLAINPIYQIMLILQNTPMDLGQQLKPYPLDNETSNLDQIIDFRETSEGLRATVAYSTALFKRRTIVRMLEHYKAVCESATADPDTKIRNLEYLTDSERRELLTDFNDTAAAYPEDRCVHQLFVEQARSKPEKIAAVFDGRHLTYKQLLDKTEALALFLQNRGAGADRLVGICMDRSLDMLIGILGTLRAGAAYVPLDPDYPDDRLAYMLNDSKVKVILTQGSLLEKVSILSGGEVEPLALDRQWPELQAEVDRLTEDGATLGDGSDGNDLAYVIYTSGSTGKPKGVMVEHRALMNRVYWMQRAYPLKEDDVVLQKTPFSFDVSVWEFVWPMMTGSSMVFASPGGHKDVDYLTRLINESGVTTLHFVPSMFSIYLRHAATACPGVRQIFCSGEALDAQMVHEYKNKFPTAALHNLYGPTEAAIDVTAFDCAELAASSVPIGAPIANTQIYVLDENQNPQPVGRPGELHIAGDGLARGYLNRPNLTAEKFVANPFRPGNRMYKSGDLARWLDDGNIEYLGRIDTQVKIRGFRIELGEIETCLNTFPGISDSVVVVQGSDSDKRLVAFYTAVDSNSEATPVCPDSVKAHLQASLPEHMVPGAFIPVAEIPLTPNGKVNRRELEMMDVSVDSSQGYVAARNETEGELVAIWAEALKRPHSEIGINDNFFELGGNSLLAVKLVASINSAFERAITLPSLFAAPTVAALADVIGGDGQTADILVPMQTKGGQPPIFGLPGADGNVLSLQQLSAELGAGQPFFGLQAVDLDGRSPAPESIEMIAEHNVRVILSSGAEGPYRLIGYSYGGVVAYEMTRILQKKNKRVESLMFLDTLAPSTLRKHTDSDELDMLFDGCVSTAKFKFGVDLEVDKKTLSELPRERRFQYMADAFTEHGVDIPLQELATTFERMQAMDHCLRAYRPEKLERPVDAVLFRAFASLQWDEPIPADYGWSELLQRPLRIHDVNANHFSIIEAAPSKEVAGIINRWAV